MNFLLWVEATLLFAAAVLSGIGAAWITPQIVIRTTLVPETAVRAGLALLVATSLGGGYACLVLWWKQRKLSHLLRQPGPRGQIFITPRTVSQVASSLLAQELAGTPFRIVIQPGKEAISLRVFLRLPPEASVSNLAERLQELLTTELSRRTSLKIQEVQVVVHGTSRASP